jgi:hypothetical protein
VKTVVRSRVVHLQAALTPRGVEQGAENGGSEALCSGGGAESGAAVDFAHLADPELQVVVEGWEALASPLKAAILAMVRAALDS